ncbi:MAG: hypothetical protein WCI73_18405, partial [Phycisphaerae bacterium]
MRSTHWLVLGLLALAITFVWPKADKVNAQTTPTAAPISLEQRLATAERKLANLQKILDIPLDDDAAIARVVAQA